YQGPIGSLISPHLQGMKEFKHLSYASSLCGKCTEVCPVGIDIQKMLLLNRRDAVAQGLAPGMERRAWKGFTYAIQRRGLIDFFSRSEEHTSELQSRENLVCRLLLEKKKSELNRSLT